MKTEQVTVHLDPDLYLAIRRVASDYETSASSVVRRIIRQWARSPEADLHPFNPDEWTVEGIFYSFHTMRRKGDNRRAHRIAHNRTNLWVLPDDHTTGQKRSRTISDAYASAHACGLDPLAYVAGRLLRVGADRLYFEEVDGG